MARKILDIYDEIITEKENQTELSALLPGSETSTNLLNDLTSGSKVAIWRLWAFLMAVAIHIHETYWDMFLIKVKEVIATAPTGTPAWYRKKIFEFQYGDSLTLLNDHYVYNPIDITKQIITRCAIEERSNGVVAIKVVKGENPLTKLTTAEKNALESYIHKIKFAGTRIAVFSLDPDILEIHYNIFYDPIIPLTEVKGNINAEIGIFLEKLPFNAKFDITQFTDALQKAEGVTDPKFQQASITPSGGISTTFTNEIIPAAGYINLSDTIDNLFNFTADV